MPRLPWRRNERLMAVLAVAVPVSLCGLLPHVAADALPQERLLALAAATAGLIVTGVLIAMWLQGRAENRLAALEGVVEAAGPLPGVDIAGDHAAADRTARRMRWVLPAALAGVPLAVWTVARLLKTVWPGAPAWFVWALVLLHAGLALAAILHRAAMPEVRWLLYLVAFVLLGYFVPLGWVDRLFPAGPLTGLAKLGVLIFLASLIFSARDTLAVLLAKSAWTAGRYDRALAWIRRLSFGRPSARLLELEGMAHGLAGQHAEAERCLRLALARTGETTRADRIGLLSCLGETLSDQHRYTEAQRCSQLAVDLGDNVVGSARVDLATMLLRQGIEPERALALIDEAMRIARGPVARRIEPVRWAHRAWALAKLDRIEEAEQALLRAVPSPSENYPALLGGSHWAAGMALLAMRKPDRAAERFRAACAAEPGGKYGALALRQLNQQTA